MLPAVRSLLMLHPAGGNCRDDQADFKGPRDFEQERLGRFGAPL